MKLTRLSVLLLAVILGLGACEETVFDPTSPAGSTPYVICVLNPKDSAQYVRIQRSYICQENAYTYSGNSDSLYYDKDDLRVFLTRFDTLDGSIMDDPIELFLTREIAKDSGSFASTGHYLYKTTEPVYAEFDYELSIEFINEEKKVTSRIQPLGSWNLKHAFEEEQRKTRYNWYHPESIEYFTDLTPNNHPQLTRFLFVEMSDSDTTNKYVEYFHKYDEFTNMDENLDEFDFMGDDFLLRFLAREIPAIPNVRRVAVGIDFMIQLADSNLVLYRRVEDPNSSNLHTAEFNNMRGGGVGLFASRYKLTIFGKMLKPEEVDSISIGSITRHLNFADSKGRFHGGI